MGNIYTNSNGRISLEVHRNPTVGSVSDFETRIPIGSDLARPDPIGPGIGFMDLGRTIQKSSERNNAVYNGLNSD